MTIVELMVAVTIGLLLTVVIAQLFLGSRQTFATTDDVSRMQENIRFTQQMLIRIIHLASYKSSPNALTVGRDGKPGVFDPPNVALFAVDGGGTTSDSLTIRYQGSGDGLGIADGTVVDCVGTKVDAGGFAINTFSIAPGANGGLLCNGVEVVPNVVNMQVLFGEDTDSPADFNANRYVPLAGVANMTNVVSVRIGLLFKTPTATSKAITDARTYDMLDDATVVLGPFADRSIYRVVTTTINFRNRTP